MEEEFYRIRLLKNHSIKVFTPNDLEREYINTSIYSDFAAGKFTKKHKTEYLKIIDNLIKKGVQGVILGCTEIPLLIKQEDVTIPVFDTLELHVREAVKYILKD